MPLDYDDDDDDYYYNHESNEQPWSWVCLTSVCWTTDGRFGGILCSTTEPDVRLNHNTNIHIHRVTRKENR